MNANHHFEIGKDHIVCQDYALSGVGVDGTTAYVIISDGCSASPQVDVGARILALSAKETLASCGGSSYYELFGLNIIQKAKGIFNVLPYLHPQALDATLLIAWVKNDILTAYMYGDGVFFYKGKAESRSLHISFLNDKPDFNGAPAYLSYNLDAKRINGYNSMGGIKMIEEVVDRLDGTDLSITHKILQPFDSVVVKMPVVGGDVFGVCSDGVGSFRKADNEIIPYTDILKQVTDYKSTAGVFVERCVKFFKRNCVKELTTHSDDLSVAAIVV